MKKILFVIARYSDHRQNIFDDIISPRNEKYCDLHGIKYVEIKNDITLPLIRGNPIWWKFNVIQSLLRDGKLNDGDIINCHDADMLIVDNNAVFNSDKSFSYSIDSGNTHCMGWFSININTWSRKLVDLILCENRFQKLGSLKTLHPRFNTYSSLWDIWAEQASWYSLAGIQRHSDIPFWDMPNFGFHSEKTEDTVYSLDELQDNVDIFPTNYNVTEWIGESSCEFNINKLHDKKDVKLRHFTGNNWGVYKNWI